jgi:hypothetical protein
MRPFENFPSCSCMWPKPKFCSQIAIIHNWFANAVPTSAWPNANHHMNLKTKIVTTSIGPQDSIRVASRGPK